MGFISCSCGSGDVVCIKDAKQACSCGGLQLVLEERFPPGYTIPDEYQEEEKDDASKKWLAEYSLLPLKPSLKTMETLLHKAHDFFSCKDEMKYLRRRVEEVNVILESKVLF